MEKIDTKEIKKARQQAGLTQQQAGNLLNVHIRTWQKWEYGERKMSPAMWELFRIKTGEGK
jgi:DNA (cytosine-5)-methyltransferase 1